MKTTKWLIEKNFWRGLVFSDAGFAHDYPGTLGTAATAIDYWYFICLELSYG